MGNMRSANRPTCGDVVFLFDGSPCFMIIALFVLKVIGIDIKVVYSSADIKSWAEKADTNKYPDFVKLLLSGLPPVCCSTKG